MKTTIKRISILLFGTLVLLSTGACGRDGSQVNEIGLIYEGGAIQEKTFRGILPPGSTFEKVGLGSQVYRYRIDQRSYIAKAGGGASVDTAPVVVVSDDDVRLATEYQLYFKLNQSPKIIQRFHENLGVKTEAWTPEGWTQMLKTYFEPQIERSLEAAALGHKWRDLYGSEDARRTFQGETVARLKDAIKETIGDDYFCGPAYDGKNECGAFTLTVGKPTPVSEGIIAAVEAEQTAIAKTIAQEQENARINKELEAERFLVELYGPQGALLREAIRSGKVQQFIIDPSGRTAPRPPE